MVLSEIGVFLRLLRERKGYTFREAAEKSGVSHSYIRYLEEGKRPGTNTPINPTPDTLRKLATAYDQSYEDLLSRAGYLDELLLEADKRETENGGKSPLKNELIKEFDKLSKDDQQYFYQLIKRIPKQS